MSILSATRKKEVQPVPVPCQNPRAKHSLHEHISRRAYELYEQGGRKHGHHETHWHQAESQVAKEISDIRESASWYTFNYPVDDFRPEDVHVSVESQGATVLVERLHLAEGQQLDNPLVSREALFIIARWPSEVDASTASAYVQDGVLSVTVKRTEVG